MDKLTRNPAPQVCLRPFVPADRAAMLELLTDAAVAKTYMLPVFSAREEAAPLFERLLALSQDAARFVRCIEKDGAPVGILNDVEMTGETVELGWAVLPAHWGQGCATAALAAAVPIMSNTMLINRSKNNIMKENTKFSIAITLSVATKNTAAKASVMKNTLNTHNAFLRFWSCFFCSYF